MQATDKSTLLEPSDDPIVDHVGNSMMSHGAMLWQAALYNNGAINRKTAIYGESYDSAEAKKAGV